MYLFINIFNKDRGRSNTMEERKKTGKSYLWALFAFLLAVAADQFTKWLAVTYLKDQDPLIIIPGVFQFRYLENRGAAFGILQNRQIVFAVGALLIFFAVVFIYGRIPQKRRFVPLRRFEVTKDAHRPFIVSADKMQTQVLGTVFDVNAYPGNAPAVTLYQGRVKVGKAASPLEKEIVPGQCATLTTSGDIRLTKATQTEKEGWTKDEFYYDNTEMITVLQNIGTWYNISVICHSADLLHKRVHFRFSRNVPIKTLLNVLNDLGIAHFQYKDKQIVVE